MRSHFSQGAVTIFASPVVPIKSLNLMTILSELYHDLLKSQALKGSCSPLHRPGLALYVFTALSPLSVYTSLVLGGGGREVVTALEE